CLCRRRVGEPQGIRILGIDTDHVAAIGRHRVAAAQGLHDPYDGTSREGRPSPTGDLDDFTSPTQRDRFTRTHIELTAWLFLLLGVTCYSVDTASRFPSSAACSVCQASVAHLTRT